MTQFHEAPISLETSTAEPYLCVLITTNMVYFLAAIIGLGFFAYAGALIRMVPPREVQNKVKEEYYIYNEKSAHGHGHDDHGDAGHH